MSKGVLVWCFTGKQACIVRSLLKARVIAMSTPWEDGCIL